MNIEQTKAEYIDHMGSDLMVVNAARTSFGKESDWGEVRTEVLTDETKTFDNGIEYTKARERTHFILKPEDANLIRYLATGYRTKEWDAFLDEIRDAVINGSPADLTNLLHAYKRRAQHWAPFAHPHLSLRMTLPMFLARQFVKHQVGGVWSEESRRYISDEPGVWFPNEWHGRPDDIKQGSDGVIDLNQWRWRDDNSMDSYTGINEPWHPEAIVLETLNAYNGLLARGVAPEEARIVLPLNTMTTVTWTGSLLFWSRVCNQRVDSHAQLAAQELGRQIADIVRPHFPVSWAALCGE